MPRQLAALACVLFIVWLFWRDRGKNDGVSAATWVPFWWMFFAGSRFLSHWLNSLGIYRSGGASLEAYMEGSPVDMPVFLILIISSAIILTGRRLDWSAVASQNAVLVLFYLFAVASVLWSDYPFVSFKRLIKSVGSVSMVLVILTEERPFAALGTIIKRLAFLLLPLSILFIKYYPEMGRQYHVTGAQMFTGVTMQKNSLGQLCMFIGLYFCWSLLYVRDKRTDLGRRPDAVTYLAVLGMTSWLLLASNSATALVCIVVATLLFLAGRIPAVAGRREGVMALAAGCVVLYVILQPLVDVNSFILGLLNRRPDLTTRVPMWHDLLAMAGSPLVGFGWQSFWLGGRLDIAESRWDVTSTHNTYLDMYLNLGVIGLVLLVGLVVAGLLRVRRLFAADSEVALFSFSCIVVLVLYGWTETVDFGVSNTYALLLLGILTTPVPLRAARQAGSWRRRVRAPASPDGGGGSPAGDSRAVAEASSSVRAAQSGGFLRSRAVRRRRT